MAISKLRKLYESFSFIRPIIALIDKKLDINIDQSCRFFPDDPELASKKIMAKQALAQIFNGIEYSDDFSVDKKIWIYWDKGIEAAPDVVKVALVSWATTNPDFEVVFLDEEKIQNYFDFKSLFYNLTIDVGVAGKSDLIRAYLLSRFGGVWVDSTTFCWVPLNSWLTTAMKDCGFFVFRQRQERKDRQIKSWFMASSKGNPIIVNLLQALVAYDFKSRDRTLTMLNYKEYSDSKNISREGTGYGLLQQLEAVGAFPYFHIHYLFNEAVKADKAKDLWNIAKLSVNNHVNASGDIGDAYVSKQNYRKKYMQSKTYQERVKQLQLLNNPDVYVSEC
jgi:hypothetical protein